MKRTVPHQIAADLADYVAFGRTPSMLILGILSNDLRAAAEACPKEEIPRFWDIVNYCFSHCPPKAMGSVDAVKNWVLKFRGEKSHGLPNQTPC